VVCEGKANQMHLRVSSPDGKKLLFVVGQEFDGNFLLKSDIESKPQEIFPARNGDETLWSPDSKAVAITTCFGANGPCKVNTTLDDDRFSPFEIVQESFAAGHEDDICYTSANVGALTWEDSSDKIVLIAQVPTANCDDHNGGYFEAFAVSYSEEKIISRFNMQETIRRWHRIMGRGLRDDIALVRKDARIRKK